TLSAPTMVRDVQAGTVTSAEWTAADFGQEPVSPAALKADGPADSAGIIREILAGVETPAARVAVANAAAGLLATGRVASLREGVDVARDAIRSGRAARVLESLQRTTDD